MGKVGTRYNDLKRRWRNFPRFLFRPVIDAAQFGETKYTTFNFLKGQTVLNCLDSIDRHLDAFTDPDMPDEDSESKITHLGHVAWNALVAAYMIKTRPDLDDRYKGEHDEKTIKKTI